MRLIQFKKVTPIACLLAAAASVSMGATVPLIETFDYANAAAITAGTGWTTPGAGSLSLVGGVDDAKAALTDKADLTLALGGAPANVWCRVVAKPTPFDDSVASPDIGTSRAAFYLAATRNKIVVRDGAIWSPTEYSVTPDANGWYTFIVHLDYPNDVWNLYAGGDYKGGCVKLNASPLGFAANGSGLSQLTVTGVATVDAIAMANDHLAASSDKANVYVVAHSIPANIATHVGLPAGYDSTGIAPTEDSLEGLVGDDLLTWLGNSDTMVLRLPYDSNTGIQQQYDVVTGTPSAWNTVTGPANLENAHITPGTGLWITKPANGVLVCFVDCNGLHEATPKQVYGAVGPLSPPMGGWNSLAWNKSYAAIPVNGAGLGLTDGGADVGQGDIMYIRINGVLKRFVRDATGTWKDGANEALGNIQPNQAFWFFRKTSDFQWD
jgi:hypothetical protein